MDDLKAKTKEVKKSSNSNNVSPEDPDPAKALIFVIAVGAVAAKAANLIEYPSMRALGELLAALIVLLASRYKK